MYRTLKLVAWFASQLSQRGVQLVGWLITTLSFDVLRLRRRVVLANLGIAFGEEIPPNELVKIGRRSIYHFVLTFLELFRSKKHNISQDVKILGRHHLDGALKEGQGVYCLCFHLGNWEAMCSAMTRQVTPSHVVVKKVGGDHLNRFVDEMRTHNEFHWVRKNKGEKGTAYPKIVEILDRNEIVGFAFDQARPGEPRLPFFGRGAKTNTSLAAIWRKRPAPIVPGFIRRVKPGSHILEFLPPLDMKITEDPTQDVLDHSKQFNQVVESVVRQYPDQYFWMHNRWK